MEIDRLAVPVFRTGWFREKNKGRQVGIEILVGNEC